MLGFKLSPEIRSGRGVKAELPSLVRNSRCRTYYLLGYDWREALRAWRAKGHRVPPVMITVANRTETAARIKYAFDHGKIRIEELRSGPHFWHSLELHRMLEEAGSTLRARRGRQAAPLVCVHGRPPRFCRPIMAGLSRSARV